jgi:hypothetical protein
VNTTLFRPVGLYELELIWDLEMHAFPPRLPNQAIFYPVANIDYAREIARGWNTKDSNSGFAGYVTSFDIESSHLSRFEPHTVGSSVHAEYWIPANELNSFNQAIRGLIRLEEGFFGADFKGSVPNAFNLRAKDVTAQFVFLSKDWDYSRLDVWGEVYANRKAVFLNWLFWAQSDFSDAGITEEKKRATLENLRKCWEDHHIAVPLPKV